MNVQPSPQAAPGPAPDPAPDLAACVGVIRTSIVDWSATNPLLGRALDPVTAQILVLLQLLSNLFARFAAGDLPIQKPPAPAACATPRPCTAPAVLHHTQARHRAVRRPLTPRAAHAGSTGTTAPTPSAGQALRHIGARPATRPPNCPNPAGAGATNRPRPIFSARPPAASACP